MALHDFQSKGLIRIELQFWLVHVDAGCFVLLMYFLWVGNLRLVDWGNVDLAGFPVHRWLWVDNGSHLFDHTIMADSLIGNLSFILKTRGIAIKVHGSTLRKGLTSIHSVCAVYVNFLLYPWSIDRVNLGQSHILLQLHSLTLSVKFHQLLFLGWLINELGLDDLLFGYVWA